MPRAKKIIVGDQVLIKQGMNTINGYDTVREIELARELGLSDWMAGHAMQRAGSVASPTFVTHILEDPFGDGFDVAVIRNEIMHPAHDFFVRVDCIVFKARPKGTKPVTKKDNKLVKELAKIETLGTHEILGNDDKMAHLRVAIDKNIPSLLIGDTGTGKTTIIKHLADEYKKAYVRFNLTGETTVDEFLGKYVLINQQTVWEDGVLLDAMKNGKWLIVDEINVALPEILFVLHSLLDDDKTVTVTTHNGEIVKPHEDFRFFSTMNPVDEYAGTKELNKAFMSRFGMILTLDYPEPQVEAKVVQIKGGIPNEMAMQLVDVATDIRAKKKNGKVYYTCSTRDLIQCGQLVDGLGLLDAFVVAVGNKSGVDYTEVMGSFKDVTGMYARANTVGHVLNLDYLVKRSEELNAKEKAFEKNKSQIEEEIKARLLNSLLGKGDKAIEADKVEPQEGQLAEETVDIMEIDF